MDGLTRSRLACGRGGRLSTVTEYAGIGSYLEAFSQLQQRTARQPEWLRALRQKAFGQFCDAGFPTLKHEAWRFTDVTPISRESFRLAGDEKAQVTAEDIAPFTLPGAACRLVFVNGHFTPALSSLGPLPAGIEAGSLAAEIDRGNEALEAHLGHYLDTNRDSFCSLNTAFVEDGAYVHIARGTVSQEPIHLLFVSTEADSPLMIHPRNLLIAEPQTQAAIVEEHISIGDGTVFNNVATELVASENAVVAHHVVEYENRKTFHVATLRIEQDRDSDVRSHSLLVGGGLVRNNIHPVLAGPGCNNLINGLFMGDDRQHIDNYMLVEHASDHCTSHQFYNGILSGYAHGVFHGMILVHKAGQQTDAKQTNRNLLLSDSAQMDTKPQLEIYADDVKCTHSATIGQIDEKALYYLRSRGIEESAARDMLLFAFASECLGRIQSKAARGYFERLVHQSFPDEVLSSGPAVDGGRRWEEIG